MKWIALLIVVVVLMSGCAGQYNRSDTKGVTGLPDWQTGDQVTKDKLNTWMNAHDETAASVDAMEAVNGILKMDGAGTPSAAEAGVDYALPGEAGGTPAWGVGEEYMSLEIIQHEGTFYTCRDGFDHTATADDEPGVGVNWETYWYAHTTFSDYADKVAEGDTSVEIVDTGTDGEITFTADGAEIMSITSSGVVMPIITADSSISVDDTASPVVVKIVTVGETVGMWQPVKYVTAQGEYMLADANASGLWPADCISIGDTSDDAGSSATDGEDILCMVMGYGYNTEWTASDGARICLSETAGNLVDCSYLVWDAENDCAQEVGKVEGVDRIWFDFTKPELVHEAP